MEYRVKVVPRAGRDLYGIYDWIGAGSSGAALAWYRGLREAIRSLGNAPNRCPITPEDRHLRQLLYGAKPNVYRVIFRTLEREKRVDVLHIRHGARQEFKAGDLR
jgi:plasmid stabilization system protein ParE